METLHLLERLVVHETGTIFRNLELLLLNLLAKLPAGSIISTPSLRDNDSISSRAVHSARLHDEGEDVHGGQAERQVTVGVTVVAWLSLAQKPTQLIYSPSRQ